MPSALAITRSSGVVINPRTRSALAPTYTVVTVTTAMSLRGYCRTFSERIAWKPASRMIRLTTVATTGRRMNKSVKFMVLLLPGRGLPIQGSRVRFIIGLNAVVHLHRDSAAQLEDPGTHDLFARLDTGNNRHLIATGRARFFELLLRFLARLAVRPLFKIGRASCME